MVISSIYILTALGCNFFVFQIFCLPVWWALLALVIFFLSIIIIPFVRQVRLANTLYFFIGTGVPICFYFIVFLADPWEDNWLINWYFYVLSIFLVFGLGLLPLLPLYLLNHIRLYFKKASQTGRKFLVVGILAPIIAAIIYIPIFNHYLKGFEFAVKQGPDAIKNLPRNYFTERILGIGFKYHTRLCIWDGWRPPLHDPYLNTALWFTSDDHFPFGSYPFIEGYDLALSERIRYYHLLFPDKPIRIDCPCSYMPDGMTYFSDYGWDGYFPPNPPVETEGN